MKTTPVISLCSISSLIVVIIISIAINFLPTAATAQQPAAVLDIDGNEVRAGVKYYILPVVRGRGGGLTEGSAGNFTCPLSVIQEDLEVRNGLPVTFTPVNSSSRLVRVSTDHNIQFSGSVSICILSSVWQLNDSELESTGKFFITTGGVMGNPGVETISNWFRIEAHGRSDYKLVFCPGVCDFCRPVCGDLGIFIQDDGKRRLALSLTAAEDIQAPFAVFFKKA